MQRPVFVLSAIVLCVGAIRTANATLIDFDDIPGYTCECIPGAVIPPEFIVDDEYLPRGVLFDTAGGGIFIAAAGNAPSLPNTMAGLGAGSVIDFFAPISVSFWNPDGSAATVDFVSITLTDTSDHAVLRAYDIDGALLGAVLGGAADTMTVRFPGSISSVVILPNYAAFDNLAFGNAVPIPGAIWLFVCALSGLAGSVRRHR